MSRKIPPASRNCTRGYRSPAEAAASGEGGSAAAAGASAAAACCSICAISSSTTRFGGVGSCSFWGRWGFTTNYFSFFRLWDRDFLADVHTGRREFREAFESFLRCVGLSAGQIDEVEAASHARRRHLEKHARPLPGVRNTLWRLHQAGFVMGLLCDSEHPTAELRGRMQRFGIEKLFPTLVSSIDLRHCMPAPEIYLSAVKLMNLPPEQVAFVGHDRVELAGAAAVGMTTIAFNFDPDAQADVHITRFEELIEVLGSPLG